MEINLLVSSFVRQIPKEIPWSLEDKETHFVLEFTNPSEKIERYFKKYYLPNSSEIHIFNNDYQKLIDLSLTLRRFCLDTH